MTRREQIWLDFKTWTIRKAIFCFGLGACVTSSAFREHYWLAMAGFALGVLAFATLDTFNSKPTINKSENL
jgi:hypothetical protein